MPNLNFFIAFVLAIFVQSVAPLIRIVRLIFSAVSGNGVDFISRHYRCDFCDVFSYFLRFFQF